MIGRNILLWARVDSTTLKSGPSFRLRSTRLYFLGTCYPMYPRGIEFSVPLLNSSQLQSYLVPCTSARIIIIPKLQNICYIKFPSELLSLCFEHLPNCYSTRYHSSGAGPDCVREHLSRALPTERIFNLLRSISSVSHIPKYSQKLRDILEIIIKWLQVSCWWMQLKKLFRLKIRFVSRVSVPSDRATCTIISRPWFVMKYVEQTWLVWKENPKLSFGIDFKWVVDNLRLFDVMAAYWDEEIQKSETVDTSRR